MSEVKKETVEELSDSKLDMIIAFDTTGSMSAYIEDVKKHVKELIPKMLKTNEDMRIGIVAFGDYCDMESATVFGRAYQFIDLTTNENDLIKFVCEAKNTSGGDGDEFYELVIRKIVDEASWRDDAKKSVLLIADANPHPVGYCYKDYVVGNQIDWREEAARGIEKGIQFDTLSLHYTGEGWYKELSSMSNGVYSQFQSSHKTSEFIETAAYARGGARSAAAYAAVVSGMALRGDTEMLNIAANYCVKNCCVDTKSINDMANVSGVNLATDATSVASTIKVESADETIKAAVGVLSDTKTSV